MSSPVDEKDPRHYSGDGQYSSEHTILNDSHSISNQYSSDKENLHTRRGQGLRVEVDNDGVSTVQDIKSPSRSREEASRLDDDLRLLQVERQVSAMEEETTDTEHSRSKSKMRRERSRREEMIDDFDVVTNPLHETTQIYKPPLHPTTRMGKFFKRVHESNVLVRYFTYIVPVVLIILIPLLVGALVDNAKDVSVGGVSLLWFCVWLEIVWLTLWAGRLVAKALPYPTGLIMSLFTNNSKKWRDMVKQLELAATLFFWWLGIEISFLPTMTNHSVRPNSTGVVYYWQKTMNKVLVSFLVLASLNLIEKIIIQLIAISFHLRTYQDRIELNQFQINSLTKLYVCSKERLTVDDSELDDHEDRPGSGARTPGQVFEKAQKGTKQAITKFGDVAGKIAGDFTGRRVVKSSHPSQVILTLLANELSSMRLARRLWRTFHEEGSEYVHLGDLAPAFETADESEATFSMFDKDMNGDISMEELETVCVEIGRERKAITASLKDLDSVVSKLDNCFMFIVVVISVLVLISLLSEAAASVLVSAGSTILALSWLLQATAQEFLQSIIFVFVKHPFDVGDRVTIYGLTGAGLLGDDYFVKEIALLYTEFKKMEGQVVQAPNSYLNAIFILNHRRSGSIAEAIPVAFKFPTTMDKIDTLRQRLKEYVIEEKRDFLPKILIEVRDVTDMYSLGVNVIVFYKSSWQNELQRLTRRNKFVCALAVILDDLEFEAPIRKYPGHSVEFPYYLQHVSGQTSTINQGSYPSYPPHIGPEQSVETTSDMAQEGEPFPPYTSSRAARPSNASQPRSNSAVRYRGESISAMGKRLDLSGGAAQWASADPTGDVYQDRNLRSRLPKSMQSPSRSSQGRASKERPRDIGPSVTRSSTYAAGDTHQHSFIGRAHSTSIHRNRFFGRPSHDERDRMEVGMAGIPEAPTPGAPKPAFQRIDPRSGTISPAAMRTSMEEVARAQSAGQVHAPQHTAAFPITQWQQQWQQDHQQ